MNVTFAPRGILQMDDARIIFRNFSGAPSQYNREGDRNFAVVIPDEGLANRLVEDGWNVKIKDARDAGDPPFMYLPVKIKFNDRGPICYLQTGNRLNKLDEESIDVLDNVDIASVDLDIRPYDWEVNGKTGRSAYLQSIKVVQAIDRFAAQFAEDDVPFE